jgi:hypothetical protein
MWITKVITIGQKFIGWGREVATGNDGMGSASRVIALSVAFTVVGVLIAHVCMNHGLPTSEQMYGLSALIAAGTGAYATNKIRRDSRGQDDQNNQPPPPPPPQGGQ